MPQVPLRLGVAPLSALDLPPTEYIRAAAAAGFSSVGLRLQPVSPDDPAFPLDQRSLEFRAISAALRENGMEALDAEVFSIDPRTSQADWLPILDVAESLGIRYLNVVGDHPDSAAFADIVGQLSVDARERRILPVLEPIAYRHLDTYETAVDLALEVGCAVELDILHFVRTGAELKTIADNSRLFPILQICDAPLALRQDLILDQAEGEDPRRDRMIAESRFLRLLPGEGEAPIRSLLELLPETTRISVEIPNRTLRAGMTAGVYLQLLYRSVSEYLHAGASFAAKP